jgi:pSer/pThr/pTyr-binding forkhead associated (FHA) protein
LTAGSAAAKLKAEDHSEEERAHMLGLLQVTHGPDKGRTFSLPRGQKIVIGRGPQAQAGLTDPQVSRFHCQIQVQGDKVLLYDSGNAAGTWVNGERITQHELQPGDVISIGETQLSFQWSDVDEQRTEPFEE